MIHLVGFDICLTAMLDVPHFVKAGCQSLRGLYLEEGYDLFFVGCSIYPAFL